MPVVADASPLIILARAGHLTLLRQLFVEVWVPPAVAAESFRLQPSRPGAAELAAIAGTWLRELTPADEEPLRLVRIEVDAGEAEAIALAQERGLLLLIDDPSGRRAARTRGIPLIGSAGVLSLSKRRGLLETVRHPLDDLLRSGLRLSRGLYEQILSDAGESS